MGEIPAEFCCKSGSVSSGERISKIDYDLTKFTQMFSSPVFETLCAFGFRLIGLFCRRSIHIRPGYPKVFQRRPQATAGAIF